MEDEDMAIARALQAQFDAEEAHEEVMSFVPEQFRYASPAKKAKLDHDQETSIIAPEWEDLDPTPDLQALFLQFNNKFFWNKLLMCEVKWSPRMTVCAGVCSYQRRSGFCSIRLSVPLLKLRPRKDLVETLLHEMIHAYLFVTDGDDDHDGHGPAFHSHMHRINKEAGTKISVYHNFHDEVAVYKTHWWKCNGPCQKRPPFYGLVKRCMNRKPGPYDRWWNEHEANCGGTFVKIKEPEGFGQKKAKDTSKPLVKGQKDIRSLFGSPGVIKATGSCEKENGNPMGSSSTANGKPVGKSSNVSNQVNIHGFSGPSTSSESSSLGSGGGRGNIFGFGGTSFKSPSSSSAGSLKNSGRVGTFTVGNHSKVADNSLGGHVIKTGSLVTVGNHESQPSTGDPLNASPASVREQLRNFWAAKSCGGSSSTVSKTKDDDSSALTSGKTKNDGASNSTAKSACCPVCGKSILENEINSHLDDCLQSAENCDFDKQEEKRDILCPVCQREVLAEEINDHLDFCIAASD